MLCPMKFALPIDFSGNECEQDKCAWWDEGTLQCAVCHLVEILNIESLIANTVDSMRRENK